nr:hypothetical protein [Marinicella sp. W31]MDC2879693.1 hypothetical protein [Marinicella sp. W31]
MPASKIGRDRLVLERSGERLTLDNAVLCDRHRDEYAAVYTRFAVLIDRDQSDVDATPLRHVIEAFDADETTVAASFSC